MDVPKRNMLRERSQARRGRSRILHSDRIHSARNQTQACPGWRLRGVACKGEGRAFQGVAGHSDLLWEVVTRWITHLPKLAQLDTLTGYVF